jgi:hypothetical protein
VPVITKTKNNSSEIAHKKMKKTLLVLVSLAFFWSCDQPSSDSSVQNDDNKEINASSTLAQFVALDRAYIPPLFFTSMENREASQASFAELQQEWTAFQAADAQLFDDPEWAGDLKKIDDHLKEAEAIIAEGEGLKEAHEALEHLREIFLVARQRNDFDYFVDYLTAFHEPMEQIVLTAKETPPDQWTAETTAKIQSIVPEAETRWQAVQNASFTASDYGFNEQRFQKMQQFLTAETQALQQLKNVLDQEGSISELRASAMGIKPNFAGLFKLFGNLEAYQKDKKSL